MDKSFNEEELSDIMKEIEALEENLHIEDVKPQVAPKLQPKPEPKLSPVEDEDFIEAKKEAPGKVYAKEQSEEMPEVVKISPKAEPKKNWSNAPSSMSFKVAGNMQLDLEFDIEGKHVQIAIDDSGLVIALDGGASFKLPLKKSA